MASIFSHPTRNTGKTIHYMYIEMTLCKHGNGTNTYYIVRAATRVVVAGKLCTQDTSNCISLLSLYVHVMTLMLKTSMYEVVFKQNCATQ